MSIIQTDFCQIFPPRGSLISSCVFCEALVRHCTLCSGFGVYSRTFPFALWAAFLDESEQQEVKLSLLWSLHPESSVSALHLTTSLCHQIQSECANHMWCTNTKQPGKQEAVCGAGVRSGSRESDAATELEPWFSCTRSQSGGELVCVDDDANSWS